MITSKKRVSCGVKSHLQESNRLGLTSRRVPGHSGQDAGNTLMQSSISSHCIQQFAPSWLYQTYPYFDDTDFLCHIFPSSLDPISVTCIFSIHLDSPTTPANSLPPHTSIAAGNSITANDFHKFINECMLCSFLNLNLMSRFTVLVPKKTFTLLLVFVK